MTAYETYCVAHDLAYKYFWEGVNHDVNLEFGSYEYELYWAKYEAMNEHAKELFNRWIGNI